MKIIGIIIAVALDLSLYGFIYYMGYKQGKDESLKIKSNIEFDIGKVANVDK